MFSDLDDEKESAADVDHLPDSLIIFSADMDGVDIMRRRYPELLDQAADFSPLHHIKRSYQTLSGFVERETIFVSKTNGLWKR